MLHRLHRPWCRNSKVASVVENTAVSADRQSPRGQAEKSKSLSFEDEEEVKPERRKMTVKERWHWVYNKIM